VHSHQSTKLALGFLVDGDVFGLERNSLHLESLQHALLLMLHLLTHDIQDMFVYIVGLAEYSV